MLDIVGRQRHNMQSPREGGDHSRETTKQEMKRGEANVAYLHI